MQLVLSGNRIIAHGEDCFLCMGGTVICRETGRVFQNATVAECDNCPSDIDSVGYEYHAGIFVPVAPYGKTEGGYLMAACFECGTPRSTDISISDVRDRLNTYATITVSYPNGSVCTCEKNGVVLTASDTGGSYAFNVPDAGTWTIKITNGTDTAERAVEITKRWQYEKLGINYFAATITVTYPSGSVCTCSDGVTTLMAPDTSGECVFTVPNAGTWTVTSVSGDKSDSKAVSITADGQSESVTLSYIPYLYPGKELTPLAWEWKATGGSAMPTISYKSDSVVITTGGGFGVAYFPDKVNLANYTRLVADTTLGGSVSQYDGEQFNPQGLYIWNEVGTGYAQNSVAKALYGTTLGDKVLTIDVSSLNGEYYIGFGIANPGTPAQTITVREVYPE